MLFREVAQRPGDFALVGLVGALALEGGAITRAGIAWFGMGPTPIRARQAEAALVGASLAGIDAEADVKLTYLPGSSVLDVLRPKASSQPAAASLSVAVGALLGRTVAGVVTQAERSLSGTTALWLGDARS